MLNPPARMTASPSMSVFHQWLLAGPACNRPRSTIIVHIADGRHCGQLIREIADYLNEYDADAEGRWLAATPDLVEKITRDPNHRRMLGLQENPSSDPEGSAIEHLNTLGVLGQRGHVVFRAPGVSDDSLHLSNAFHAGVGRAWEIPNKCHLILDPELMGRPCIAHVIGDVFLEWLHCEDLSSQSIEQIRKNTRGK